jgi:hypothetical protein
MLVAWRQLREQIAVFDKAIRVLVKFVAFDPGRAAAPRDGGATHMGFDSRHGLGLCDLTNYVAQSHTPQAHCVRFGRAVTGRTRNTRYQAPR